MQICTIDSDEIDSSLFRLVLIGGYVEVTSLRNGRIFLEDLLATTCTAKRRYFQLGQENYSSDRK